MNVAVAERLLRQARPDQPRRLPAREARVERALALVVAAATITLALAASAERPFDPLAFAACVLAYAAAARVLLYVGGGCALPTQLFLVPMLFALPLDLVPLAVVGAGQLAAAPGRRLTAVGDAGYVFAPVAILAAAGAPSAAAVSALVIVLACLGQWALDAALSVGREWLGRGIRPTAQLSVMVRVWTVDALLVPVGLLAVADADRLLPALAALLGVVVVLGRVTRDRNRRLIEAMDRLEQLERERARVRVSIARLSRSLGATLDRRTILEAVLGAALDALAAPGGRVVLSGSGLAHEESSDAARALIREAETAASATSAPARIEAGDWVAIAHPLRTDQDAGTLTIAAPAGRVSAEDDRLLGYLAAQAEAALRMIELHDRLRSQATLDELTGLANHRRFQEVLGKAVAQTQRTGLPLSLVLIDVDDFKRVNDTHGHQCGDEVLRAIGAVLRERSRASDTPARYGGEELAVVMPGAGAAGACASAEALREAIAALEIAGPNGPVRVTASFGVCELGTAADDATALVGGADAALYAAKHSGKNRVVEAGAALTA